MQDVEYKWLMVELAHRQIKRGSRIISDFIPSTSPGGMVWMFLDARRLSQHSPW